MLLGYKKRFVYPIKIGSKVHTMRKPRKIKPKIGETLHMYTALRTKYCELITNKEKLISTQKVSVRVSKVKDGYDVKIKVDGRSLNLSEMKQLAQFDGFDSLSDFAEFWLIGANGRKLKHIRSTLDLYHWTDLRY